MNSNLLKPLILLLLGAALIIAGWQYLAGRESSPPNQEISIGIATWPGFAPVYIARQKGYFSDLEVKIDIVDDFSARRAAYESGNHQFTIYTIDSFAFDVGKGLDGEVVLILDESFGADGIVSRPEITEISQLKGRRVAYTRGSPAHFFLLNALKQANLTINDITTVEADDPTIAAQAFLGGSVDAAVTWEPFLTQISNSGDGRILLSTKEMPGKIVDVLVVSRAVTEDSPDVVQSVVSGWQRAQRDIQDNDSEAASIMAQGLGMDVDEFQSISEGVRFATQDMNNRYLVTSEDTGESVASILFWEAGNLWHAENLSELPARQKDYFSPEYFLQE